MGFRSLIEFQGDLVDFFGQDVRGVKRVVCPSCGYEFSNYIETGSLGCSKCYDIFREEILRDIQRKA